MSPSAGITTEAVKIDTSEITTPSKRKQEGDESIEPEIDIRDLRKSPIRRLRRQTKERDQY